MVRRTKLETEQTRRSIIDAARTTFLKRGMTGTTLEHIAEAAGVTRGAIYWHFANKKELFDAMRSQVCLPMLDETNTAMLAKSREDPLGCVAEFLLELFGELMSCNDTRETFEIMSFKCEYVGEFEKELDEHRLKSAAMINDLEKVYRRASRHGQLRAGLGPRAAAVETMAFVMGLIRLWLLDRDGALVRPNVRALVAAHVAGRRSVPAAVTA